MANKAGQIIARGERTWLVRIFMGRDPGSGKRRYHNKTIRGTLRDRRLTSTSHSGSGTSECSSSLPV